jgi:hypothetical protein
VENRLLSDDNVVLELRELGDDLASQQADRGC